MDNPPEDGPCEVTITAPDREWLRNFVRGLVQDRLAAAAHVDSMDTTYRWSEQIHEAEEGRALVHTVFRSVQEIALRVRDEHPYDVACVAAVPILDGEPRYIDWIRGSTRLPECEDRPCSRS